MWGVQFWRENQKTGRRRRRRRRRTRRVAKDATGHQRTRRRPRTLRWARGRASKLQGRASNFDWLATKARRWPGPPRPRPRRRRRRDHAGVAGAGDAVGAAGRRRGRRYGVALRALRRWQPQPSLTRWRCNARSARAAAQPPRRWTARRRTCCRSAGPVPTPTATTPARWRACAMPRTRGSPSARCTRAPSSTSSC